MNKLRPGSTDSVFSFPVSFAFKNLKVLNWNMYYEGEDRAWHVVNIHQYTPDSYELIVAGDEEGDDGVMTRINERFIVDGDTTEVWGDWNEQEW